MFRALLLIAIALAACDSKPKAAGTKSAEEILNAPDALTRANEANNKFLASLDLLCKLTTEAKTSDRTDSEKATMIAEAFQASGPDPDFLKLMQALAAEVPAERMPILKAEAAKRGRKNYSCPALDE